MTRLAGGFLGATNVAVGGNGRIYVAEMFGNKVSLLRRGVVSKVAELPNPAERGVQGRQALRVVRRVPATGPSPRCGSGAADTGTTLAPAVGADREVGAHARSRTVG